MAVWLELMRVVFVLPSELDAQLRRDSGLTLYEYLVMAILSEQPGWRLGLKDLSVLTNGSLSRLSHVVTRLEKAAMVKRETNPHNGRLTDAILSDRGHEAIADAAGGHVAKARALVFDHLSHRQVDQLLPIIDKIGKPPPDGP